LKIFDAFHDAQYYLKIGSVEKIAIKIFDSKKLFLIVYRGHQFIIFLKRFVTLAFFSKTLISRLKALKVF